VFFVPGIVIAVVTFPGVIMHELAHELACKIARVRVYNVRYFRFGNPAGYVEHEQPSHYRQTFFIVIAPFIFNSLVALSVFSSALMLPEEAIRFSISSYPAEIPAVWMKYLFYWLGFSVAMHAFPSSGDADNLWSHAKRVWRRSALAIIGFPLVILIKIAEILKIIWFDFFYALTLLLLIQQNASLPFADWYPFTLLRGFLDIVNDLKSSYLTLQAYLPQMGSVTRDVSGILESNPSSAVGLLIITAAIIGAIVIGKRVKRWSKKRAEIYDESRERRGQLKQVKECTFCRRRPVHWCEDCNKPLCQSCYEEMHYTLIESRKMRLGLDKPSNSVKSVDYEKGSREESCVICGSKYYNHEMVRIKPDRTDLVCIRCWQKVMPKDQNPSGFWYCAVCDRKFSSKDEYLSHHWATHP
jgi:hypothetical protein